MKSIDIFIAGAKNLDEYRDALKILANELNVENKLKNKNVLLRMCDYKDIGDNQNDYDDFIKHNAAGLFAIIVDNFGTETQKEMKLAAQRFAKTKRSMVKVFIKRSDDIERMNVIYNFIKLILGEGQYGEEFNDVTEFKSRAKKYLKDYIRDAHKKEKLAQKIKKIGFSVLALIIALIGFLTSNFFPKEEILLMVGGGSAKNMIEKTGDISLKTRENTMVVGMPSGNTWPLIIEDLLYEKTKDDVNYKLISMSATKADDSVFVFDKKHKMSQLGAIIEVLVGYDDLILYLDSTVAKERGLKDYITKDQFSKLLKDCKDRCNIFATRENSGTFIEYEALTDVDIKSLAPMVYHDKVGLVDVCNVSGCDAKKPVMLLGSEFYASSDIKDQKVEGLRIYKDEHKKEIVKKPIYLYFALKVASPDELKIDKSIETFLREFASKSQGEEGKTLDSLLNVKVKDGRVKRGVANEKLRINIKDLKDY